MPGKKPRPSRSDSLKLNDSMIIVEEENEKTEEERTLKNMTMLPPDSIRWMNKRRPLNQVITKPRHIPPHLASQLREMFDGLDFDGGGEIDMKEFKEAIAYVTKYSSVATSEILGDPKNVAAIFRAMDADGSGQVDFDEFVLAMTADKSNSGRSKDLTKFRSTFYDFANIHRRQNMLEVIKNDHLDDKTKLKEFQRLFRVEYFHAEEINLSVEDQVAKTTKEVMKEKRKLAKLYKDKRHLEIVRSRAADSITKAERDRLVRYHKPGTKFEIPDINKASKSYSKRKKFGQKLEEFSMRKKTFLPSLSDSKIEIRQHRESTIRDLKLSRAIDKDLLIPPAVSNKQEWEKKAQTYERTGEF